MQKQICNFSHSSGFQDKTSFFFQNLMKTNYGKKKSWEHLQKWIFGSKYIPRSLKHLRFSDNLTDIIQLWLRDVLRLGRCELIPLFTPMSHCHKQRQTRSLASRILFAVIVPLPLKFLISLCCLLIHALFFPQITMGYSIRIILAQRETMYELTIRCVNCTQRSSYIRYSGDAAVLDWLALWRGTLPAVKSWFHNCAET